MEKMTDREIHCVREEGNRLVGTAVVFDKPSKRITERGRTFTEVIKPGAFDLNRNITFVFRHNDDAVYGDTASKTLRLTEDKVGIHFELDLPPYAERLREQVAKGAIPGMSFRFLPESVETNGDVQIVRKGMLAHIAAVYSPAYPQTKVSLRDDQSQKIRQRKVAIRLHTA